MRQKSSSYLRQRRKALFQRLSSMEPTFLRGSLIKRFKRCGKPGCKCLTGQGHGPKFYLSVSMPHTRPEMIYVPQDHKEKVEAYLKNFQKVRRTLEEICEINRELLRRREHF